MVQLLKLGCRDVCIPLGGCDIAVSQQFLYDSYVRSAGDEHRGKLCRRIKRKNRVFFIYILSDYLFSAFISRFLQAANIEDR